MKYDERISHDKQNMYLDPNYHCAKRLTTSEFPVYKQQQNKEEKKIENRKTNKKYGKSTN